MNATRIRWRAGRCWAGSAATDRPVDAKTASVAALRIISLLFIDLHSSMVEIAGLGPFKHGMNDEDAAFHAIAFGVK
jgi:hypothetical protein